MIKYFILGVLFVSFFTPVLSQLVSIIENFSEFITYSIAFKIYKIKKNMNLYKKNNEKEEEEQDQQIRAIGFKIQEKEKYNTQEDYYNEK